MNEFQFKPEIAEIYGVNEAIFLHSLSFWLIKNWSNGTNYHDGRYWSYDTYKAIAARFPFWTVRQIERIVASCEEKGAILVGNYNEDKTVRTKWYTLTGKAEAVYLPKIVDCISPNGEMTEPQADAPILPDGAMQNTKEGHPITQTGNCNKVTVTYPDKNVPPISPKGDKQSLSQFEQFWWSYPTGHRDKKQDALKAWRRLKPDDALAGRIMEALELFKSSPGWAKDGGQYIPLPASWIRGRRWEDESIWDKPETVPTDEEGEWL